MACAVPGCDCLVFSANVWAPEKCRDCLHSHTNRNSTNSNTNTSINKSHSQSRVGFDGTDWVQKRGSRGGSGNLAVGQRGVGNITARGGSGGYSVNTGNGTTNVGSSKTESVEKKPLSGASSASTSSASGFGSNARKWMTEKKKSFASIRTPRGGEANREQSGAELPGSASSPLERQLSSSVDSPKGSSQSGSGGLVSVVQSPPALSSSAPTVATGHSVTTSSSSSSSSSSPVPGAARSPSAALSTVPAGWGFDTLTQLCRCYLTDAAADSSLGFHPQIPSKKISATEKTFAEVGWRRLSPSEKPAAQPSSDLRPCCVYENVLFGSGGRAREIIVLTPSGVFWKNLTGTTPRFASWGEIQRDSLEVSRRRIRFAVVGVFAHASIDFYKPDAPIKDRLAELLKDIFRRAPTPADLPASAILLSHVGAGGSSSSALSGGSLTSNGTSSSSSRALPVHVSEPTLVRRLGPEAALRAVYGSTAAMLDDPGDDPNALTLRVQFPEDFPLEFKTLVIKNARTTRVSEALSQLKSMVPGELWENFFRKHETSSREIGFYVTADQKWLNPDDLLGSYRGLWMLKKVDVRPLPGDLAVTSAVTAVNSSSPTLSQPVSATPAVQPSSAPKGTLQSSPSTSREVEALRQQVQHLEKQLGTAQLTLQMTQEELDAATTANGKLESQVDYFKKQLGLARAENEQLKVEFANMEQTMEAQADRFAEGLQRLSLVARKSVGVSHSMAEAAPKGAEVAVLEGEIDDIFAGFG